MGEIKQQIEEAIRVSRENGYTTNAVIVQTFYKNESDLKSLGFGFRFDDSKKLGDTYLNNDHTISCVIAIVENQGLNYEHIA